MDAASAVRLQSLSAALAGAVVPEEVARVAVREGLAAAGASAGVVWVPAADRAWIECLWQEGELAPGIGSAVPAWGTPMDEVLSSGRPLFMVGHSELEARAAVRADTQLPSPGRMAYLPLHAHETLIGVLSFSFAEDRSFADTEERFLEMLADQCAVALDRAALFAQERSARQDADRARQRLALLSELTRLLMSSLNPRTVLERLVSLVTRRFADACVVMVPGDHGLQRAVVRGRGLMTPEAYRRLVDQPEIPFDSSEPAAVAFRTGVPQIIDVTDDMHEHMRQAGAPAGDLEGRFTALLVRLSAHGEMLGVMVFLAGPRRGRFNADEISLAVEVAARAGLALDNAKRFAREHDAAEMLQRAVLPRRLPGVEGLTLSAEYRPGIAGMPAGGDWYDAVPLTGGRLYFSVGDVMGKGTAAAALMGQVRSALRAYAVLEAQPSVVLERTDVLFDTLREDRLVTAVVGTIDPVSGQVRLANAGHPAPVVIGSDGTVRMVEGGTSLLLGTGALRGGTSVPSRTEHRFDLAPGDTLVLFSDGLLERRGEHLAKGFERLVHAVDRLRAEGGQGPLAGRLVDLVSADDEIDDDVVVLCITLEAASSAGGAGTGARSLAAEGTALAEDRAPSGDGAPSGEGAPGDGAPHSNGVAHRGASSPAVPETPGATAVAPEVSKEPVPGMSVGAAPAPPGGSGGSTAAGREVPTGT